MYTTFFGLRELPFAHTHDLRFFYSTPATSSIEERIKTALQQHSNLILLTGDPGTGKTTLSRRIIASLKENIRVISLPFSAASFDDVVGYLCEHFGIASQGHDSLTRVLAIQEYLRTSAHQGFTTVLYIDEAQHLPKETLDRLRLLLHLRGPTGKLLPILLVGQPWLETKLAHPDLCHLQQYVTIHCRLVPLTPDAVQAFIAHRLRVAGSNHKDLFSSDSLRLIAQYSQAVPQLINVICDNSLLTASLTGSPTVTAAIVAEVIENLQLTASDSFSSPSQVQPMPVDEQPPAVSHPLAKRDLATHPSWTSHFAWASIGVFCAWLSSTPDLPGFFPLFSSQSHTAHLSSTDTGTSALVATPPQLPQPSTAHSPEDQIAERLSLQLQTSSLSQNPQGKQPPTLEPLHSRLSMTQDQPAYPQSSLTQTQNSTELPTSQSFSAQPQQAPIVTSSQSQTGDDSQSLHKTTEAMTSLVLTSSIASPQTQSPSLTRSENTRANEITAQPAPHLTKAQQGESQSVHKSRTAFRPAALFRATQDGNEREVQRLLQTRGPINAKDTRGWTALMHAAHDNQPVIVRMLLSHGAQPNIANNEGETALILAADNNHYVITQLLLEHGAAIDAKSKLGWTALMYAAAKGHRLTVEALLNNGANPNVRDNDGQTASAYALRQGTVPSLGDYPFTSVSVQTRIDRVVAAKQRWLKRHEYREIASLLEQAERK